MPKASKKKIYNLSKPMMRPLEPTSQIGYDTTPAKCIISWIRFPESSAIPVDYADKYSDIELQYWGGYPPKTTDALQDGTNIQPVVECSYAEGWKASALSPTDGVFSFSTLADGATSSSTDTDKPFSISMWFMMSTPLGTRQEYLFGKLGQGASGIEYWAQINSAGTELVWRLYDTTVGPTSFVEVNIDLPQYPAITKGKWVHLVCTYDGMGGNNACNGMKIYINGDAASVTTTAGTYNGMQPEYSKYLYMGAHGATEFTGLISEFAVWDSEISAGAISTLYRVSKFKGFEPMSGYISNPPRTIIRQRDDATGSYPTTLRTGDVSRKGNYASAFNEATMVMDFSKNVTLRYPTVIDDNNPNYDKYQNETVATPNTLPDLTGTGNMIMGTSDAHIRFTPGESITPFNDSQSMIRNTPFYMTGTSAAFVPGFSAPLGSKVKIEIDLTPTREQKLTRYTTAWDSWDTSGEFYGQDMSGFCYFNFENKTWEQIGLYDQATGNRRPSDWAAGEIDYGGSRDVVSGSGNFLRQFTPSANYYASLRDLNYYIASTYGGQWSDYTSSINDVGYANIASPTVSNFAPFANQYHATASQLLDMSQHISHPFVLEKAVLETPVYVQRIFKADTDRQGVSSARIDSENYVFFMYRQQNNTTHDTVDSATYVSESERFIILSGSLCFYNSKLLAAMTESLSGVYPFEPVHGPAFSHDWGVSTFSSNTTASYSGIVEAELMPAISSPGILQQENLPWREDYPTPGPQDPTENDWSSVKHVWLGGNSCRPFGSSSWTGKTSDIQDFGRSHNKDTLPTTYFWEDTLYQQSEKLGGKVQYSDERGLRSPGDTAGAKQPDVQMTMINFPVVSVSDAGNPSTVSPYILFPNDKLIFGIDAAINRPWFADISAQSNRYPTFSGVSKHSASLDITGSYMQLLPSASKITLYGSLIQDNVQKYHSLNQHLTSDSVHEDVHEIIVDQFQIETMDQYSGSYMSNFRAIYTDPVSIYYHGGPGGITAPQSTNIPKGAFSKISTMIGYHSTIVAPSATRPSILTMSTASFNRFVTLESTNETYWDSYTPDPWEISLINTASSVYTGSTSGGIRLGRSNYSDNYDRDWLYAFPFEPKYSSLKRTGIQRGRSEGYAYANIKEYPQINIFPNIATGPPFFDGSSFGYGPTRSWVQPIVYPPASIDTVRYSSYADFSAAVRTTKEIPLIAYFGIGDGVSGSVGVYQTPRYRGTGFQYLGFDFATYRGFKYGLKNAVQQKTTAIFRSDRFGQFRDMLEQRPQSVFKYEGKAMTTRQSITAENAASANSGGGFFSSFATNTANVSWTPNDEQYRSPEPVFCEFVDLSKNSDDEWVYTQIIPSKRELETFNCSNLSPHCTSSMPWFDDGEFINRVYYDDEGDIVT